MGKGKLGAVLSWLYGNSNPRPRPQQRRSASNGDKGAGSRRATPTGAGREWAIKVAAPVCMPIRGLIVSAMNELEERYGGSVAYRIGEAGWIDNVAAVSGLFNRQVDFSQEPDNRYPYCQAATILVPTQRAGWTEYLILRQGRLSIYGPLYTERNRRWAAQHQHGSLPASWNGHGQLIPWMDSGCTVRMPPPKPPPKR